MGEEEARKSRKAVEKVEKVEKAGQIGVLLHRKIEEREPQTRFEKEALPQEEDGGLGANDGRVRAPADDGKSPFVQRKEEEEGLEKAKWPPVFVPSEQPSPGPYAF